MRGQWVGPGDLYSYLRNASGGKHSTTQLLQTFYKCRKGDGEDLHDYSSALSQTLSSVVSAKHSGQTEDIRQDIVQSAVQTG